MNKFPKWTPGQLLKDTEITLDGCRYMISLVMDDVRLDASPGAPYNLDYTTNKAVYEIERNEVHELAATRLHRLLTIRGITIAESRDPTFWLRQGLADPKAPFIKMEPHPTRKAIDGRWRIICAVSLVDQLVERALFSGLQSMVKSVYLKSGSAVGIGFSDSQLTDFGEFIFDLSSSPRLASTPVSSDISGWDRSVTLWMLTEVSKIVEVMMDEPRLYTNAARAIQYWAMAMASATYALPSYGLYAKETPGLMASGSYMTTVWNTLMRLYVSELAGASFAVAAGDDCLEWVTCSLDEHKARYAAMGFTMRDVSSTTGTAFSFCSHQYRRDVWGQWAASLETWPKAVYKLVAYNADLDQQEAVKYEIRHNSLETRLRVLDVLKHIPQPVDP